MIYLKHRRELDRALPSNSTLNRTVFVQLLALGLFDILVTLPPCILQIVEDAMEGGYVGFWPGWEFIHADFSTIETVTSDEWRSGGFWGNFDVRIDQRVNPLCAGAFFLLFGLTEQKRSRYKNLFWTVMRPFGVKPRIDPVTSDIAFGTGPKATSQTDELPATVV